MHYSPEKRTQSTQQLYRSYAALLYPLRHYFIHFDTTLSAVLTVLLNHCAIAPLPTWKEKALVPEPEAEPEGGEVCWEVAAPASEVPACIGAPACMFSVSAAMVQRVMCLSCVCMQSW